MNKILAWHFTDGYKLRDGTPLKVGKTYHFESTPVFCDSGYHASIKILDALIYAPGTVVSRVKCWDITEKNNDKFVCKNRKVLWTFDIEMILYEFACRVAEHILKRYENGDRRNYEAIEAKRKWMRGEISDSELDAAWAAASAVEKTTAKVVARAVGSDAVRAAQERLLRSMVNKLLEKKK